MRPTVVRLAVVLAAAVAFARPAAADQITPPPVPGNLVIPEGNKPYLVGAAYGTQNYICLPSATAPSGYAFTLFGPQATLFGDDGGQIITHYLSPNPAEAGLPRATWRHSKDTSAVWAFATPATTSNDPAYVEAGAIPWLRLQVVGQQYGPDGGDRLIETTFIHRVNTSGGLAPATGCAGAADVGKKALVPYTTDYIFYKARK